MLTNGSVSMGFSNKWLYWELYTKSERVREDSVKCKINKLEGHEDKDIKAIVFLWRFTFCGWIYPKIYLYGTNRYEIYGKYKTMTYKKKLSNNNRHPFPPYWQTAANVEIKAICS